MPIGGKYLDLYSIDSTWDDLDSISKDSLSRIVQVDRYPGGLAGSLAGLLDVGYLKWDFPGFDTTFVLPEVEDSLEEESEERIVNNTGNHYNPGLQNVNASKSMKFALYPNPSSGNFIVECASGRLTVFAADGRQVADYDVAEGKTDVQLPAGLSPGVYLTRYKPKDGGLPVNKQLIYQP